MDSSPTTTTVTEYYDRWSHWANGYDSDGDETRLRVPLSCVSEEYLRNLDLSNVTAECGKPMTQEEFDEYRKQRSATVLNAASSASSSVAE